MSGRPARIKQGDANKLLNAVKRAGFARARIVAHPDGRLEVSAEASDAASDEPMTEYEAWRAKNARAGERD